MERHRGFDSGNVIFAERTAHSIDRVYPGRTNSDYFRDQRVQLRHDVAGINVRIDPNSAATRRVIKGYSPGRRLKISLWIFRINPALDGVQSRSRMRDVRRKRLPGSDADLFLYQVAAVSLFCNGVRDLDARVHFEEIEISILIDQELDRARILVIDGFASSRRPHFAKARRHER
jgi:hypothetical protein